MAVFDDGPTINMKIYYAVCAFMHPKLTCRNNNDTAVNSRYMCCPTDISTNQQTLLNVFDGKTCKRLSFGCRAGHINNTATKICQ